MHSSVGPCSVGRKSHHKQNGGSSVKDLLPSCWLVLSKNSGSLLLAGLIWDSGSSLGTLDEWVHTEPPKRPQGCFIHVPWYQHWASQAETGCCQLVESFSLPDDLVTLLWWWFPGEHQCVYKNLHTLPTAIGPPTCLFPRPFCSQSSFFLTSQSTFFYS